MTGPLDCAGAESGGADRLEVVSGMEADGLTPAPSTVRQVLGATDLPIRVMLRSRNDFEARPGEVERLGDLVEEFGALGVHGFVLGFLRRDSGLDTDAVALLAGRIARAGRAWTFHRAIDHAVDLDQAFAVLAQLPALTSVLTAGSGAGVAHGLEELLGWAATDWRDRLLVGGGLRRGHVAKLARAGIRGFHVGSGARPGGRWSDPVSADLVGAWRSLLDREAGASHGT